MSARTLLAAAALALVAGVGAGVAIRVLPGLGAGPSATASPSAAATLPSFAPTSEPTAAPTPSPTIAPVATPTPVPTPVLVPAPLTGLLVDPAVAARHVVAVMIDDQADARPQSGLASADVVFQAPAEGGIPRYMALFQSGEPPSVGPVRSSRLYFIAWAAAWNAVYVHAGGSPQALALLQSSDGRGAVVWNADEFALGPAFLWRSTTRYAPHNIYTDFAHLRRIVPRVGAADAIAPNAAVPTFWQFRTDVPLVERPYGGTIVVPYLANEIRYAYDRSTNSYLRSVSVEGREVDAGTKTRIAPKNVVIMEVSFAPLNDGSHKGRLEAQFTGTGRAWIATGGHTVRGTWAKASMTAPTLFFGPGGVVELLTAGQTFVQVVQVGTPITIHDGVVHLRPAIIGRLDPAGPIVS